MVTQDRLYKQPLAISDQEMKNSQNMFNLYLKDIFMLNQDVITKIKSIQYGDENLINNVGSKCF